MVLHLTLITLKYFTMSSCRIVVENILFIISQPLEISSRNFLLDMVKTSFLKCTCHVGSSWVITHFFLYLCIPHWCDNSVHTMATTFLGFSPILRISSCVLCNASKFFMERNQTNVWVRDFSTYHSFPLTHEDIGHSIGVQELGLCIFSIFFVKSPIIFVYRGSPLL